MNIEIDLGANGSEIKKPASSLIKILVLGDFSGKGRFDAASGENSGIRNMFNPDPSKLDAAVARLRC